MVQVVCTIFLLALLNEHLFVFVLIQTRFDDMWRKYETYSGGEQLFGLTTTDYPVLAKTKKELNLLNKLYGLYNAVIDGKVKRFLFIGIPSGDIFCTFCSLL